LLKKLLFIPKKWRCDIITWSFIGILCLYLAITKQIALDGQSIEKLHINKTILGYEPNYL
ncbi:hypothetical protein FMJ57_25650, partial [Klebsiella pneumoniae]|nr:hypothetical protein [Klebsiella pneumoniae]